MYGTLWNWRIVASSRNSESPWSLQKAGVNRTRLLASSLQSPDASYLPLERNEYECPANEYLIVTTFILLCLLRYSRMACDIWEFVIWGTQLSDQQISSVTFGWSAATLSRICIKALAMSFPTRPGMHSIQIAQSAFGRVAIFSGRNTTNKQFSLVISLTFFFFSHCKLSCYVQIMKILLFDANWYILTFLILISSHFSHRSVLGMWSSIL